MFHGNQRINKSGKTKEELYLNTCSIHRGLWRQIHITAKMIDVVIRSVRPYKIDTKRLHFKCMLNAVRHLKERSLPCCAANMFSLKLNLSKKHARSGWLEGLNTLFDLHLYIEGVKVILVFRAKNLKE